ncbi:hypothetical protein M0804_006304 [Polistes exclamans]|nr:hypothetical protein M0804_006304 [Polistes exclamans]
MASRRNAKQSDIESMEKLAETGKISPPKRTKLAKSTIVKMKDTKSTKSTKIHTADNNNQIIETELEPLKKLRTRNKADTTAKPTAKEQPVQEKTPKSKRVIKKSKPLTEDNLSSNDSNGLIDEANDEISEKIPTKKTRAKKIPKKAGNIADLNTIDDAKVKPNTRANKVEALKEADSILADTKEKKKYVAEKLPKLPKVPKESKETKETKETKTKMKPVKKVVEKNEAVVEEKKKVINTRTKTTKNNTKVVMNDEKKAKSQTTKKMQNQTDNVPDKTENNVEENISKPVKGRSRKINKDNVTNHSKKAHMKESVAINEKENELKANKLLSEEEEEEEEKKEEEEEQFSSFPSKEEEMMEIEPNEISKNNTPQKAATNTSNLEKDLVDSDLSGSNKNNKNKMNDSTSNRKDVSINE